VDPVLMDLQATLALRELQDTRDRQVWLAFRDSAECLDLLVPRADGAILACLALRDLLESLENVDPKVLRDLQDRRERREAQEILDSPVLPEKLAHLEPWEIVALLDSRVFRDSLDPQVSLACLVSRATEAILVTRGHKAIRDQLGDRESLVHPD